MITNKYTITRARAALDKSYARALWLSVAYRSSSSPCLGFRRSRFVCRVDVIARLVVYAQGSLDESQAIGFSVCASLGCARTSPPRNRGVHAPLGSTFPAPPVLCILRFLLFRME